VRTVLLIVEFGLNTMADELEVFE